MKFLEFISAVNIFEAAKDRYTQMFTNLQPMFDALNALDPKRFQEERFNKALQEEMEWAMRVLKKQDRVIWYLRFVKIWLLRHLAQEADILDDSDEPRHDEFKPLMNNFKQAYNKAISQLAKKMGVSEDSLLGEMTVLRNGVDIFKRQMEHFLSLNLPALDAYVFSNQTPRQILADWMPIEDAWKNKRKQTVPLDREGVDTIIKYPDGAEWVNLNEEYCTAEGDAMGHCGNSADPKEGDRVLSYRTIEYVDGEQLWKPRLTFVLDRNGLLGETKGRGNQKPQERYHSRIADLLRQDFVKGIKGGGHEPENNFALEDFPKELQDELVEEKPGLASIRYDYEKRGMTKELLNRMEGLWEDTDTSFPEFKDDTFWHDTKYGLDEFVDNFGGYQAEWVLKILDGREYLYIDFGGHAYYQDELFDGLSTEVQHRVGKWVIENHESEVEEWKEENDTHYDGTDASDTMKIVKEYEIEEVTDALYRAEMTGHEYGAEKEMQDDFSSWLKDLPNNAGWDLSVSPDTTWEEDDAGTRKLGTSVEVMIDLLDNHIDAVRSHGGVAELADIKELEAPYNGWQGFDEEGAKERAEEELYETGVLTNETP